MLHFNEVPRGGGSKGTVLPPSNQNMELIKNNGQTFKLVERRQELIYVRVNNTYLSVHTREREGGERERERERVLTSYTSNVSSKMPRAFWVKIVNFISV